ncbi:MAG: hypothetical protein J6A59_00230 [Lachnospiraceae bacterium]|nr:hypothetical protein [Lachnospiraceae bacterium]
MDGNGFDTLDFGSDDFGSSDFSGFDSSSGFESDDFDSSNSFDLDNVSDSDDNQFAGSFDTDNSFPDTPADNGTLGKKAIIMIAVGIIGIILVVIIASAITKATKNVGEQKAQSQQYQQDNTMGSANNGVQQSANKNVDNIMQNSYNQQNYSNQQSQQTVITNTKDDNFTWSEITSSENVVFNESYVDMTFTVTDIQHKARAVDTNGNLVVKTKLLGSISGLSGTYEIDVPYNKGVKLVVGNSFTVHVQLGSFNDKTVVGEILY